MNNISFEVPEYYNLGFKGRKQKNCPQCKNEMEYDGWSVETVTQKISEWWFCKKCKKLFENPE